MKAKKIRVSRHGTRRLLSVAIATLLCLLSTSCTLTRTIKVEQSQEKQIQSVEVGENGSLTLTYR